MDHQHSKVERFTKLGYSHADIVRVLESLDHDAQTNDILEELIKTGHRQSSNKSAPSSTGSQPSPKLVPRGCGLPPTSSNSSPKHSPSRPDSAADSDFRPVVIDGSNVAMSHGDKKVFSCKGLQLAVKWFWDKGVRDVTVFVPLWRKEQPRPEAPITDQHILHELERRKILVYTPSRCVNGRRVVCYDDRYIVKLAFDLDGIIVSNDNYRDLQTESAQWKKFIEERLLMYTFANDKFMPPDDPLGRNGPTIDDFLRKKAWSVDSKQQHCPYGKKCTYGVKCKFYHPERTNQSQLSVADELRAMSRPASAERAKPGGLFTSTTEPGQGGVDQDAAPYLERTVTHPHAYVSSSNPTPPPLGKDEPSRSRASPIEQFACPPRDTGSPGTPWSGAYRRCPSPDADEAFGSLDSYLSRMHVQDATKSTERLSSYGYSSGVASLYQGSDNHFPSGTYGSNTQRHPSTDSYYAPLRALHNGCDHHSHACDHHSVCGQCMYARQQHNHSPRFVQHPARGSCPSLHPHNSDNHAIPHDKKQQHFQSLITPRQSHSLPDDHWGGRGGACDAGLTTRVQNPNGEQRKNLRSQLSTLFPQSVVDHIMALYPHVVDMSHLITLIQRYRAGQSQFAF